MITARVNGVAGVKKDISRELARLKNITIPEFVRHKAKVCVQDLLKWTPPRSRKKQGDPENETWPQQKANGEKMVEYDIRRMFLGVEEFDRAISRNPTVSKSPTLYRAITTAFESGNTGEVNRLLDRIHARMNVISGPSRALHSAERTARGRVKRGPHRYFVTGRGKINSFIALMQKDVGKLKAGWGAAASRLGVPPRHWPSWVKRHGANGVFMDRTGNRSNPTIHMENTDKASRDMSYNEIVGAVLAINGRKMQKELEAIKRHAERH